jgi:uncharacterized protein YfiM (DUF2279 family)
MHRFWLVFTLAHSQEGHTADRWFAGDKLQHFFTSAFVQSMSYGALRTAGVTHGTALAGATVTTLGVGVAKEVHDLHDRNEFSFRDLTWDAAGTGAATILLVRTRRD